MLRSPIPLSVAFLSFLTLAPTNAPAQDTHYSPKGQLIPAPECLTMKGAWEGGNTSCTEATHEAWLKDIQHWRMERAIRTGLTLDDSQYVDRALQWTQNSFIQPQMMVHDRFFYDPVEGRYTVDRYLKDLRDRFGGIDSVLIWSTYPNMGIDDRNQLDMVASMPGGVEGVRQMVADFHRFGVRVLFPMMMWDQGTRVPARSWPDAIAELMKQIDADGINGDTQDGVPRVFPQAAAKIGHPLAFEPEGSPSDEALAWNVLTWGQYGDSFGFVPGVDRFRWLETRHMVNISDRWARSKTDDLQYAFFNGEGWESWENIWGIWNGITPRDAEATRRVATLERAIAPFLVSAQWEPFYPMNQYGVFASRWPLADSTVWTIVNRNEYNVHTRQMSVPAGLGQRFFDLYHGVELKPLLEHGRDVLSFPLEAHGFGAILSTPSEPSVPMVQLMNTMKRYTSSPLSSISAEWKTLPQQLAGIARTKPASSLPSEMVSVPAGAYVFKVQGIEIEGSDDIGVDVQYPWEDMPRRFHEHKMEIEPFYLDKYPVTNAKFKTFLDATHYGPADRLNFLRDWTHGSFPEHAENKPVTWVSLEDARAYAKWAGKRLPHEWEWQYAAQGLDERTYPWGNEWKASAVPIPDTAQSLRGPDDVTAHPEGASPFGVMDMVGNVWQWTDEYLDEHTRAAILRGGSYYQPQGSIWYFPQAYRNDQHGKLLLMAPSYDRSGTVGFRCAMDAR